MFGKSYIFTQSWSVNSKHKNHNQKHLTCHGHIMQFTNARKKHFFSFVFYIKKVIKIIKNKSVLYKKQIQIEKGNRKRSLSNFSPTLEMNVMGKSATGDNLGAMDNPVGFKTKERNVTRFLSGLLEAVEEACLEGAVPPVWAPASSASWNCSRA